MVLDFLDFICYNVGTTKRKEVTNMYFNGYLISDLSNDALVSLFNSISGEMAKREQAKALRRTEWIRRFYSAYLNHPNASMVQNDQRIIVAAYDHCYGISIGTSYPINGDVFDFETGVAVAFAKCCGENIPDFI